MIEEKKLFTFMARPSIIERFDRAAKSQGMGRSEFLRHIILETVKAHEKGKINVRVFE